MRTAFWFIARERGESAMVCSQLCGVGHAQMVGRVVAMPYAAWRRWNDGAM
jgi:cytochrome c oxidase subunit 2